MKIEVDGVEIFSLSETQKKIIANDISADCLDEDLKRRLCWVLQHKCDRCFERLKKEWEPKLKALGIPSIPLDEEAFAQLVFAQPTYKDRLQRDEEAKLI